jgi:LPXTG-motif cell wall-anchored protein
MKTLMSHQIIPIIAAIEQTGIPALRGVFSFLALVLLLAGILIFRRRRQLFDRDPAVENDTGEVRHDRIQLIVLVWGGLTTLIVGILIDVLRA